MTLYISSASVASTQPLTPVGPLVGSVPRLFAVVLVFPASPAVPPSVWTALHGARPLAPFTTRGPVSSRYLIGKSGKLESIFSFSGEISFSKSAETSGDMDINNIRLTRRIERARMALNKLSYHWSAIKVRIQ